MGKRRKTPHHHCLRRILLVAAAAVVAATTITAATTSGQEETECSLYLAPYPPTKSTSKEGNEMIPSRRWGLYKGERANDDDSKDGTDNDHVVFFNEQDAVSIPLIDLEYQMELQSDPDVVLESGSGGVPPLSLEGTKLWLTATNANRTAVQYEADQVYMVNPGVAMMTQQQQHGPSSYYYQRLPDFPRTDPRTGATSRYSYDRQWRLAESAGHNIPAGTELSSISYYVAGGKTRSVEDDKSCVGSTTATVSAEGVVDANTVSSDTKDASTDEIVEHAWLQENGWCMDRTRRGHPSDETSTPSKKGVLAAVNIKEGGLVLPVPVVPIHRKHLHIAAVDGCKGVLWEGEQLLVNYCLGHDSSSVLLFPYGPVFHSIRFTSSREKANVGLRWAGEERMPRPDLLSLSADLLFRQYADFKHPLDAGLVLEVYSLRNIEKDEEIMLLRGPKWQSSWNFHLGQWRMPPVHGKRYQSAAALDLLADIDPDSIPSYVGVRCWVDKDEVTVHETDGVAEWTAPNSDRLQDTSSCRVISADGEEPVYYSVVVKHDGREVIVRGVPRKALIFVDKPYTGNMFLRNAFRHEHDIPDDMMPAGWKDVEHESRCGLFLAESGIPGAGLAIFTGKEIQKSEKVMSDDIVILLDNYDMHRKLGRWYNKVFDEEADKQRGKGVLDNYHWQGSSGIGGSEAESVCSIMGGAGALSNSHLGLVNSDLVTPSLTTILYRAKDPGAGASTTYTTSFRATKSILPGEEILIDYGEDYFSSRRAFRGLPRTEDYEKADKVIQKFSELVELIEASAESRRRLWEMLRGALPEKKRFVAAVPVQFEDVNQAVEIGTARALMPNTVRSIDWLERNGVCLDNIRPGLSTIRQAGRGAFATRVIRKGQIIAPMPVLHIQRQYLERYESDDDDDPEEEVTQLGSFLLKNYMFGHPSSSLLLFPYTPVVNFVNHNATRANAELRWSTTGLPAHNASWLERSPEDLETNEDHVGLIMELVATREILPGEEVFLNYNADQKQGADWDSAWNDHVRGWRPAPDAKRYVSAGELNRDVGWIKLMSEMSDDEEVDYLCFAANPKKTDSTSNRTEHESEDEAEDDKERAYEWKYQPGIFQFTHYAEDCRIQRRILSNKDYDDAYNRKDSIRPVDVRYEASIRFDGVKSVTVTNIPRKAVRYADMQHSSDLFLPNAFRHEAYLPDSMIPKAWRDVEQ